MFIFSQGKSKTVVQIGSKFVEINENFKFFLCSQNEQIVLSEFVRNNLSIVNFSTTKSALSSQVKKIDNFLNYFYLNKKNFRF